MTPELREASKRAVQVLTSDGRVLAAGRATLFVLREVGWHPRLVALASVPPFVWAVELGYRAVARNRGFFGRFLFRKGSGADGDGGSSCSLE